MKKIQGFDPIPYPELRKLVISLPNINQPVLQKDGIIRDHSLFVASHVAVLDSAPKNIDPTPQEKAYRLNILPWYERLLIYYYIRKELIEA